MNMRRMKRRILEMTARWITRRRRTQEAFATCLDVTALTSAHALIGRIASTVVNGPIGQIEKRAAIANVVLDTYEGIMNRRKFLASSIGALAAPAAPAVVRAPTKVVDWPGVWPGVVSTVICIENELINSEQIRALLEKLNEQLRFAK